MQTNLIVGNIISMTAGGFTAASSWARTRKWIYLHQLFQCLLLAVASVFFGSWSGVTTFLLCAVRSWLLSLDRFDQKACLIFVAALLAIGLPANNLGAWGLIPVLASAGYTIGTLIARKEIPIKLNMIAELTLWLIYEIHIRDISSAVLDGATILLAVISMLRSLATDSSEKPY